MRKCTLSLSSWRLFIVFILITVFLFTPLKSQARDCELTSMLLDRMYLNWLESNKSRISHNHHYYGDLKHTFEDYEYYKADQRRQRAIKNIDNQWLKAREQLDNECN